MADAVPRKCLGLFSHNTTFSFAPEFCLQSYAAPEPGSLTADEEPSLRLLCEFVPLS
jgi:hypothetical protein